MMVELERSIDDLLSAVDVARKAATDDCTSTTTTAVRSEDDALAERLATIRLEMSVIRARREISRAADIATVVDAMESVAAAAHMWIEDHVIADRLERMVVRRQADDARRRVDAAAAEMRTVSLRLLCPSVDIESARRTALHAVHAAGAALDDAMLSARHVR